jgi:isochorismate synthase
MTASLRHTAFPKSLARLQNAAKREAARHGEPVLACATTRVPHVDPSALFERTKDQERVLWEQPRDRFSMLAVGAAARLTGQGQGRFAQVATAWRSLAARAMVEAAEPSPLPAPICLGGFAFDAARQREPWWEGFPDALLVVPRFLFVSRGGSSWVTASAMAAPDSDPWKADTASATELCGLLLDDDEKDSERGPASDVTFEEDGQANRWKAMVTSAIQDIRRADIDKLVLARRLRALTSTPLDPRAILRRLRTGYSDCTIFAFSHGDTTFLGATPERLVRLDGRIVRGDCLAGSTARGATEDEDRLLGEALLTDKKEQHEHALVVGALRNALGPVCAKVNIADTPTLFRMPNVQHLHTPIEGMLKEEAHVLELVERLHPTPAAGGLPRDTALPRIRSCEPFDRGWYAGPVGWMDARGSGEFVVAIRSALLRGSKALLYAGCGIVAGSDPDREYEESSLKLRAMQWALNGKRT